MNRAITSILLLAYLALSWAGGAPAFASRPERESLAAPRSIASAAPKVNVAIQAGHWKSNELPDALARLRTSTGAVGGGRTEAQVTLDIAQRVARLVRARGLTAEVLPATVPTAYEVDLFISLHADGNNSSVARGYKVSTRWRSDVAALDALLVQAMESAYGKTTGMPRNASVTTAMRGYYAYSTYHGEEYRLSGTTPASIVEMGFMSNGADRAMMFNNAELLARGVVAGIDGFNSRQAEARRLQAEAERDAAASPFGRSVVILSDTANIRSGASTNTPRVASATFGDSFLLLESSGNRPSGSAPRNPSHGTQLATSRGWYKIGVSGSTPEAYISRDLVVVQE